MNTFDVIVIGGGPGGYVAAIKTSQLGFKTALIEKQHLGGVCLNWGCIPTKTLLRNAEVIHLLNEGRTFGFEFDNLSVDYSAAHKRSRRVVSRQTKGIAFLMKKNNITVFDGTASLNNSSEVEIQPSGEVLQGKNIIIATGARPRQIPGVMFDGSKIINFRDALNLTEVPSSSVIVGAGPIGMEFATIWNQYGSNVTVLEMLPNVLPLEDEDISKEAEKQFKRAGINVRTGTMVKGFTLTEEGVDIAVSVGNENDIISADKVMVAIGFVPNSEDLGLEQLDISTTRGNIDIDDNMRTSVPNIYAIGDVNGKMCLAHVASAQALIAANTIAGHKTQALDYINIPRCTYSFPETASVGLTEKQATEQGHNVITVQAPFLSNGKALAMNENKGFVKIISETKQKKILGVHIIGGHVTELIAGPAGMITAESTAKDVGQTVYSHPSMSEVIMEAAHALTGQAVHM
jgi:dihydrolipoamide dehydrogenase